jgi:hypothetical protein
MDTGDWRPLSPETGEAHHLAPGEGTQPAQGTREASIGLGDVSACGKCTSTRTMRAQETATRPEVVQHENGTRPLQWMGVTWRPSAWSFSLCVEGSTIIFLFVFLSPPLPILFPPPSHGPTLHSSVVMIEYE